MHAVDAVKLIAVLIRHHPADHVRAFTSGGSRSGQCDRRTHSLMLGRVVNGYCNYSGWGWGRGARFSSYGEANGVGDRPIAVDNGDQDGSARGDIGGVDEGVELRTGGGNGFMHLAVELDDRAMVEARAGDGENEGFGASSNRGRGNRGYDLSRRGGCEESKKSADEKAVTWDACHAEPPGECGVRLDALDFIALPRRQLRASGVFHGREVESHSPKGLVMAAPLRWTRKTYSQSPSFVVKKKLAQPGSLRSRPAGETLYSPQVRCMPKRAMRGVPRVRVGVLPTWMARSKRFSPEAYTCTWRPMSRDP